MHRITTFLTIVATLALSLPASALEDPAEAHGLAVIKQLSAPPLEDYSEMMRAHLAPEFIERRGSEDLQRIFRMLSSNHADMSVEQINHDTDSIGYLCRDDAGMWLQFEFRYSAERLIDGLSVRPSGPPLDKSAPRLTEAEWLAEFEKFVEQRVAADQFSGAVILAKDNKPVYAKAFGQADRSNGRKNTLDTPLNLGSMNKMFTGLAIAQLVEQGKLSYEDKVGEYLPEYPNKKVREEVSIHQLLTHTSGLGSYWNDAYEQRKMSLRTLDDFAALFSADPLESEPGERFGYSNNGPVVLGLIIEAVTGMDYYRYVHKHIYKPARMKHSGHFEIDDRKAGFATGYYREPGQTEWQSNLSMMGRKGSPGGGGYASANDLLRFSRALSNEKLLGAEQLAILTRGKVRMGPDASYAYLFGDHESNGHRYFGHNGGAPGINADFSIFPELGYTVIALSNYDRGAIPVANKARELIFSNN